MKELVWHEKTHQICFCTLNSLQMIEKTDRKFPLLMSRISEKIIEKLTIDRQLQEEQAANFLYNSNVFTKLSDKTTKLYLKDWTEIYDLLLAELNLK